MNDIYKNVQNRYKDDSKLSRIDNIINSELEVTNVPQLNGLYQNLDYNNHNWRTYKNIELQGNKLKVFIKKIVRKLVRWVFAESLERQNEFNASVTRSLNEISTILKDDLANRDNINKKIVELDVNYSRIIIEIEKNSLQDKDISDISSVDINTTRD